MNHAFLDSVAVKMYDYTIEDFEFLRKVFDISFFSHVKLLSDAMPHLKKSGGKVSVTSSIYGMNIINYNNNTNDNNYYY